MTFKLATAERLLVRAHIVGPGEVGPAAATAPAASVYDSDAGTPAD